MGAVLASTAGVLLAVFQAQLLPIMGWRFLIPLFAAVILGGIGNPYGALVGAFVIGVTSEVSTQWINPQLQASHRLRNYDRRVAGPTAWNFRWVQGLMNHGKRLEMVAELQTSPANPRAFRFTGPTRLPIPVMARSAAKWKLRCM